MTAIIKFRILLVLALALNSTITFSYPCKKYTLDFGSAALPGDITITWSINIGFNHCGFEKDEIRNHQFVVTVQTLFEEMLLRDTTSANLYNINTNLAGATSPLIVSILELGSREPLKILINPQDEEMPEMPTKIDSLNTYLLNGYFLNAMSILRELKRTDLIDSIRQEYEVLFPENYPGNRNFFNSYFHEQTMRVVKMPYVEGLNEFIKSINKLTTKEPKTSQGFTVYAKLSPDNQIIRHVVVPHKFKELFDRNSSLLSFFNQGAETSNLVLKIGRSKNGKKFSALNERALMDQNSRDFKATYPAPPRPIH